jgi:hypothetical protein
MVERLNRRRPMFAPISKSIMSNHRLDLSKGLDRMSISRVLAAATLMLVPAIAAPAGAQSGLNFQQWLKAVPTRTGEVAKFEHFLQGAQVAGIISTQQLLLSASAWQGCGEDSPYTLPPESDWSHIVPTLKFIRAEVVPTIGPVNAVSGYRSPELGKCAGGAPKSAHAGYYALDLTPLRAMDRAALIEKMCTVHAHFGQAYSVGLGFYDGVRFHVDTKSTRLWGSDYHAATSPCLAHTMMAQNSARGGSHGGAVSSSR